MYALCSKISTTSLLLISSSKPGLTEEINFQAEWNSCLVLLADIDLKDNFTHSPEQVKLLKKFLGLKYLKRVSVCDVDQALLFFKNYLDYKSTARSKYNGTFEISPECKIKTKIFSKIVKSSGPKVHKSGQRTTGGFSGKVKSERVYFKIEGLHLKPVEKPNIQKGYEYGSSIIPIPKELESLLKFQDDRCLKLLGFVDEDKIPRHMAMANVDVMMPVLDDLHHLKAFCGLVKNLLAMNKLGLARLIMRNKTGPKLVVLIPREISKKEGKYCLYISQLPTVEDLRQFRFSSLKASNPNQRKVVRDMISKMQLNAGNVELNLNRIVMPQSQVINNRLVQETMGNPENPEPQLRGKYQGAHPGIAASEELCRQLDLEENVRDQIQGLDSQIQDNFDLEENTEITMESKKKYWADVLKENEKMLEEEQMIQKMKDHGRESVPDEISRNYTISDFNAMMTFRGEDLVDKAVTQMKSIILDIVKKSLSGSHFSKALECMKALRRGCVTEEEAKSFNDFLGKIKKISGSDKAFLSFFKSLKENGILLISDSEVRREGASKKEAEEFFEEEEIGQEKEDDPQDDEDLLKMLDELE
jgi:ATP-dependent DNA helicase 2 subunit 2